MKAARFDYHRARDVADAVATLQREPAAKAIAGGQSLGPMLNLRLVRPALIVDVSRIAALKAVTDEGDRVRIGAGVTHAAIEDGCVGEGGGDYLRYVAGHIAYRAVRNRGTVGGSLAHADPAADWLTALTAIGAEIVIAGTKGERRVDARQFMTSAFTTALASHELVAAVLVPKLSPRARWGYCKIARKTGEWADASAAVVIDPAREYVRAVIGAVDGAPIVVGAFSMAALAASAAERASLISDAMSRALPDGDHYGRQVHTAALRRALDQAYAA